MGRNPKAGHRGAVGAPHRCVTCRHRPGPRVVTATRKTTGNPASLVEPTVHKKPCGCACHHGSDDA
ncbi:MAG: hypothetical protein ACRD0W_09645 [Acidimicrobiales bacterium]